MRFVNLKTIVLFIIAFVLLLVIRNIVSSILSLRQNSNIVTALKQQEANEKQKKQFLKEKLYQASTGQFIENEAREKLGMVKPGEHIILAPPAIIAEAKTPEADYSPNWQKWWKLFF